MGARENGALCLTVNPLIRAILSSFFRSNATGERLFSEIGQTPGKGKPHA
jgi:hypothetical protein